MTERMNDDVVARDLIKNQVRVRRGVDAPDGPVVGWIPMRGCDNRRLITVPMRAWIRAALCDEWLAT
jgi:hypothetical protein